MANHIPINPEGIMPNGLTVRQDIAIKALTAMLSTSHYCEPDVMAQKAKMAVLVTDNLVKELNKNTT